MRLYDISQEISSASAVFPGDQPFSHRLTLSMAQGGSCDVGAVTMSVHTGTHADAGGHYLPGASCIGAEPLERYLGPARVVTLEGAGEIGPEQLAGLPLEGAERVLLRTGSAPDPTRFPTDFRYLSAAAARLLAARGLRLVGVDTPSVDRWDSRTLEAHKVLGEAGVALLENLVLEHVPDGDYELIALPLRFRDLDASPVRAVLRAPG